MGCNRWEFYELLSQPGFAVIDYPDEELEKEAEVAPIWYQRGKVGNAHPTINDELYHRA